MPETFAGSQFDWEPMYKILDKEIFPKQRKTGHTAVFATLLSLTEYAARFFAPHHTSAMLATFLPKLDGTTLNSCLATQAFLCHFLPTSHPALWRRMIFRLWESFASEHWDDQWLDLLSRLSIQHVDPNVSDPRVETWLKRIAEGEDMDAVGRELAALPPSQPSLADVMDVDQDELHRPWRGIRQDVGIFTDHEWAFIMTKCLRSFNVPVGSSKARRSFLPHGSNTGAANADSQVHSIISSMKKPTDRIHSFAVLIVYNMSKDGPATPETPTASEIPTPTRGSEIDLPSLASSRAGPSKPPTYLGGSKALDSLSKLLQATEPFFHPSNYGSWQSKLCRFLQSLCWEFIRRWREEEKHDCPTPAEWRLTPQIKREFVLVVRPVALLAMFVRDPMSMSSAQQAIKSMAYLEPGLIMPPVLERALPALEGLLEVRTSSTWLSAVAYRRPADASDDRVHFGLGHCRPAARVSRRLACGPKASRDHLRAVVAWYRPQRCGKDDEHVSNGFADGRCISAELHDLQDYVHHPRGRDGPTERYHWRALAATCIRTE